jgi:hypothetical protein
MKVYLINEEARLFSGSDFNPEIFSIKELAENRFQHLRKKSLQDDCGTFYTMQEIELNKKNQENK